MADTKHILVIRFSALGDVAMTVPVVKAVLDQNPDLHITYVSRPLFEGLFNDIPRLKYIPVDLNNDYKGLAGIFKLFKYIKSTGEYDGLADLHHNLRSKVLRKLFRFAGVPYHFIDKGREGKKMLTRFPGKVLKQQQLTTERYADVFRKLGYPVRLDHKLVKKPVVLKDAVGVITGEKIKPWIGIAPFAQHKGKIYPLERTREVIKTLNQKDVTIFLFGGTPLEEEICKEWQLQYKNVVSLVGRLSIADQQLLIRQLDVMMSMDSAGMHLASLEGVPVVSVWGATHHYLGFLGYGQSEENIVADDIECRPCSTYGKKPCFRKDYACLFSIEPATIISKLEKFIS